MKNSSKRTLAVFMVLSLAGVFVALLSALMKEPVTALPIPRIITGAGQGGGAHVKGLDASGSATDINFFPYESFSGGVRVATGDVNGDGTADIITAAGPGGGPHVKVFDGSDGSLFDSFFPYDLGFKGGVYVAAGDIDDDGFDDIITGAGPGGGPHVKVFSGADGSLIESFFPYDLGFTGGVFVAAGDVDGDSVEDIVTGAGSGGGPHVKVFDGLDLSLIRSFFPFSTGFTGGVRVAAGYITSDASSDIVVAAGPGGGPHVKVIDGADLSEVDSFFPYPTGFSGGVFVAAGDLDLDGFADVVTGAGAGGGPHVKAYDVTTGDVISSFFPYDLGFNGGVFVAVGDFNRAPIAANDAYSVPEGATLTASSPGVLSNDSDPDDEPLSASVFSGPSHGTLSLQSNGSFTYVPSAGYFGPDSFVYAADDGSYSDLATVSISVVEDTVAPSVVISQATGQADPSNASTINFTVDFSETVTGFTSSDVNVGGSSGASTVIITGSGDLYNAAVTGMSVTGTVTITVDAGAATDVGGNTNTASTGDNSVTYDAASPSVSVEQASTQPDPTNASSVTFTVVFSEPVTGFTAGDLQLGGSAGPTTATVGGSGTTYTAVVSGMSGDGSVTASVAAFRAFDLAGNGNAESSSVDNAVTLDTTGPTVTLEQDSTQTDPSNSSPVSFTVVFSEPVTGFATGDVSFGGSAAPTTATVTGSGTTYEVAVSGMSATGTVTATVSSSVAIDAAGNPNFSSTSSDNSVTFDAVGPGVTVEQASTQADPTNSSPANFTVVFSEPVTGFTNSDVTVGGTAGASVVTVTGSGATYNIAVGGMNTTGTVTASVPGNRVTDTAGNGNSASTSADNLVSFDGTRPSVTINQASTQSDPTKASSVTFTVVFSEMVTGFATGDVSIAGSSSPTTATVSGSGDTYTVSVSGMTATGTVVATVDPGKASDAAGNTNTASTSSDNSVDWDGFPPTFDSIAAGAGTNLIRGTFSEPLLCSTVSSSDFLATVDGSPSAVTGTVCSGAEDAEIEVSVATTVTGTVVLQLRSSVTDEAGNVAAFPTNRSTTVDGVRPTVTINQASGQVDPSNGSTVTFTVVFSEPVSGFTTGDVTIGGTAGANSHSVSGSGTTYSVGVSGMSVTGTVTASVTADQAVDAAGNSNVASTSADNTITYDATGPRVTIDQGSTQADPTNASAVTFTVVFSEAVTGLTGSDITLGGTALPTTATVTGSGTTYDISVSGMSVTGTVTATVEADRAVDSAGNGNVAATSTDNTVAWDGFAPTVTINQASGQPDPANTSSVTFTVTFSEPVTGFTALDLSLGGSAGPTTATVTGGPSVYSAAVSGFASDGTVTATVVPAGATDGSSNGNLASTSTDNSITVDRVGPTVTIDQASTQADPTASSPVTFTVVFSESVTGFTNADVAIGGTSGPTTKSVSGAGTTYSVQVGGMTGSGSVTATVVGSAATDAAGNSSLASTSTDNVITYDVTGPQVTVEQAAGQADPTAASPINFTVSFDETPIGFTSSDVTLGGTAGATTATVTGSGTTFNVAVTGMNVTGTVTASVSAGAVTDGLGNTSSASTSTDNTVTYDATRPTVTINQAGSQADPTNDSPVNFTVVFSEAAVGFSTGDVTFGGTALPTTATVTGSGTTYNVAVSGMSGSGSVTATLAASVATDAAGNANFASTSTDGQVIYDVTLPTFDSIAAVGGSSLVTATFSEPLDCSTVATNDFVATVNGLPSIISGVDCSGTSDSTIGITVAAAPGGGQTVTINLTGVVSDPAGNDAPLASRSTTAGNAGPTISVTGGPSNAGFTNDNTPTYSGTAGDSDGSVTAVQVQLDGGGFTNSGVTCTGCPGGTVTWSFTPTSTLSDGLHTMVFRALDNVGAASSTVTRTVTVDTDVPDYTSVSATGGDAVLTATFDEPVLCSTVSSTDFLAAVNGLPVGVTSVVCSGTTDAILTVTLDTAPATGDSVALQLVGAVTDQANNEAPKPTTKTTTAS